MSTVNSTRQPIPRELIVVLLFVGAFVFCVLYGIASAKWVATCALTLWQSPIVNFIVAGVALLWLAHAVIRDAVLAALREHERTQRAN